MRKIHVLTFTTLDGVMQAPGGLEEDTSGGFRHGGWLVGYFDDFLGQQMAKQMGSEFDLLLGRRTYDIFAFARERPRRRALAEDFSGDHRQRAQALRGRYALRGFRTPRKQRLAERSHRCEVRASRRR